MVHEGERLGEIVHVRELPTYECYSMKLDKFSMNRLIKLELSSSN